MAARDLFVGAGASEVLGISADDEEVDAISFRNTSIN
jgi:hypothetical protein